MNLISFSLWGSDPKYCEGAYQNALLAMQYFPSYVCRFYYDDSVPEETLYRIGTLPNIELVHEQPNRGIYGMFWRFRPLVEEGLKVCLVRDCDSRLSFRDQRMVEEWLRTDYQFHVIRDHEHHNIQILGGTFGFRNLHDWITDTHFPWEDSRIRTQNKGDDQFWLRDFVYPHVKHSLLSHDRFGYGYMYGDKEVRKMPLKDNEDFVGKIYE